MAEERETYKAWEIIATADDNEVRISIGGREVEVTREDRSKRYSTNLLPYTDYQSLVELAKQVIDHVPDFKTRGEEPIEGTRRDGYSDTLEAIRARASDIASSRRVKRPD